MEDLSKQKNKLNLQADSKEAALKKRRLIDKIATVVVSAGGIAIILSIVTILVFISLEAIPLWYKVESSVSGSFKLNKNPAIFTSPLINQQSEDLYPTPDIIAIGVEEYREIAYLISSNGFVHFISLKDGNNIYSCTSESLKNDPASS